MTSVIGYTAVVALSIAVFGVLALFRNRGGKGPTILALCWAATLVVIHSKASNRMLVDMAKSDQPGMGRVYFALLLVAVGVLALVAVGLGLLWPRKSGRVGYPTRFGSVWLLAGGLVVGSVPATILAPNSWLAFTRNGWFWGMLIGIWGLAPSAVLEESVFRGRLFEFLRAEVKSVDYVLVLQALIYVVIHIPIEVRMAGGLSHSLVVVRGLATIFAMGWLYGWLRHSTGNLWMPTGAHIAYNALVMLAMR